MIGVGIMDNKTIREYPNNIIVTITYNNKPSSEAIKHYACKLKEIVDNKNLIDSKKQFT